MDDRILDIQHLSKKFRRGEIYNTLRDLVPALTGKLFKGAEKDDVNRREFWALRDVSFTIERGEAFGIIGGNGAGKSTILKLLTRIMRPTHGSICVTGRISAVIEVSAGFHQDLTGRENIFLNGAILGMTREEIRRRFDAIVDFSGLEEFIDTPVKRYSSGMFARLGFAVAAHVDPDILVVDEVLSVGDYLFQRKCLERMHSVVRSGATVVFVSHNLREVANLCRRSLLLERGQVQVIGPTEEVIGAYYNRGRLRDSDPSLGLRINKVEVYDGRGPRMEFESGGKFCITVEAAAQVRHDDITVVIQIVDNNQYPFFDTCTQRLGVGAIKLEAGQSLRCTFELDLSLVQGTFHVNAYLHRYVTDLAFDSWISAATFFVTGAPEARGVVTLNPSLRECKITSGPRLDVENDAAISHASF